MNFKISLLFISSTPNLALSSGPKEFELFDDGSFTYTHNGTSFPKVDTFEYTLFITYNAGGSESQVGQVFIKVNDCPTTTKDTYFV